MKIKHMKENQQDTKESWEEEFRTIFKPDMTHVEYQGSHMLYVPYEEVIHWIDKTIQKEIEKKDN
jgi:hypothetical protein